MTTSLSFFFCTHLQVNLLLQIAVSILACDFNHPAAVADVLIATAPLVVVLVAVVLAVVAAVVVAVVAAPESFAPSSSNHNFGARNGVKKG